MKTRLPILSLLFVLVSSGLVFGEPTEKQLVQWLKRFPDADSNGDGRLSIKEAQVFQQKLSTQKKTGKTQRGAPRQFKVDPGWKAKRFPDHAVSYKSPKEIAEIYAKTQRGNRDPITSYKKPTDGSLRIVGTGHSFMAPGYRTFPPITRAAGFKQPPLLTHTGGGITGSTRYKWEQENGIFQFDGEPTPKLLASIANAQWDVMMWGPYFEDRPAYYSCWIDFCLKYNPDMKFYLSDAWPQLYQLGELPKTEKELTDETVIRMGREKHGIYKKIIETLNKSYPGKVFVLPTSDAMVLSVQYYHRGELPGVEGIHKVIGKKDRSLWRDRLGYLGPGFGDLEGYVFYATNYGRSPELIKGDIPLGGTAGYPSRALDRVFRKIAWQAVVNNPLSGVKDTDRDGVGDAPMIDPSVDEKLKTPSRTFNPELFSPLSRLQDPTIRLLLKLSEGQKQAVDLVQKEWSNEFQQFSQLPREERNRSNLKESLRHFESKAAETLSVEQKNRLTRFTTVGWIGVKTFSNYRDVQLQKELAFRNDQKSAVEKLYAQWLTEAEARLLQLEKQNQGRRVHWIKIQPFNKAWNAKARDALFEILSNSQKMRFEQIQLQSDCAVEGPRVFTRPEVAKALQLTSEQRRQIAQLEKVLEKASMKRDFLQRFRATRGGYQQCFNLLTDQQRQLWKKKLGKLDLGREWLIPMGQ
jgi:hypothetical protein